MLLFKNKNLFIIILLLTIVSCSNYKNILDDKINKVSQNTFTDKDFKDLEEERKSSKNYLLYTQELARVNFILNKTQASLDKFSEAVNYYNILEEKSKISVGGLGRGALASTVGDDNSLAYEGSDFERSFDYFYRAINYLKLNKLQASLVEIRASYDIQKLAMSKREKEISKANNEISKFNFGGDALAEIKKSQSVISNTKNKFLNSYIYYVSGLVRELSGDLNGALVDYKNTLELYPNNKFVMQDALRLAEIYDRSYFDYTLKNNQNINYTKQSNYSKQSTVVIIYEQDFIPSKQEISGVVAINGSVVKFALPSYNKKQNPLYSVSVDVFKDNINILNIKTSELANIYTLAQNDLSEQYPLILVRQTTRLVSKTALQNVDNNKNQPSTLGLALYLTGAISSIAEQADLRSFRMLPSYVQLAKASIDGPFDSIRINTNNVRSVIIDNLKVEQPEFIVIYAIDTGVGIYHNIVYRTKK
jgi:hypothetical protein